MQTSGNMTESEPQIPRKSTVLRVFTVTKPNVKSCGNTLRTLMFYYTKGVVLDLVLLENLLNTFYVSFPVLAFTSDALKVSDFTPSERSYCGCFRCCRMTYFRGSKLEV